jgi:deoxyribodipyrimidine photo-lyase
VVDDRPARPDGGYVLYWMTSSRRLRWSFALQHAARWAQQLARPLLVFEALRVDYRYASARLHRFVLDGMEDNAAEADGAGVTYLPYVEPEKGHGRGLLRALSARACVVVTDEPRGFFLPRMLAAATEQLGSRVEVVDDAGVLPLSRSLRAWPTAHGFRRHLQRTLPAHLGARPVATPLSRLGLSPAEVPAEVAQRWLSTKPRSVTELPIDQEVGPVAYRGGARTGAEVLSRFVDARLSRYVDRSHPDAEAASGLSPWLHFGHVSPHEVVHTVLDREDWTPARASGSTTGARAGWWGLSPSAESFLDEMITWRELALAWATHRPRDYDDYASVPAWAQATLAEHRADARSHEYSYDQLENAETHDEVWNAAQRQLRVDGRIDNYPRMLWGKNVLAWSRTPQEAAERLKRLNDRWAVDGRDPNSYAGIFWVFGRHDRAWGPERPVFGKVRYMTSANTKRKLRLRRWLARYAPTPQMEL